VDYTLIYLDKQQLQPSIKHHGFGDIKTSRSSLINNLPLFDEDKSLIACVDLFESEPAPAK